jgi:hypothetical protein
MSIIINKPVFIFGERLTKRFEIYDGYEDICFGSFGETDDKHDNKYKPCFGLSFKCGISDIGKMKRTELGNVLLINKMLFLNSNVNTHIFNDTEKRLIREIKKKLNRTFSCEAEYELIVSEILTNNFSALNKFLINNETMLFNHYDEEYILKFKDVPINSIDVKKEKLQYSIREKIMTEPYIMLNPMYRKYFNFTIKEEELYNSFLNKQRQIHFKNEIDYFGWLGTCYEFLLLQDWNGAWLLDNILKNEISKNHGKSNKDIEKVKKDLDMINLKIGRNSIYC